MAEAAPGVILMMMRTGLGRLFQTWSYPTVTAFEGRVFIRHRYTTLEPHPTKAELEHWGGPKTMLLEGDFNGKLKVMPVSWFYGERSRRTIRPRRGRTGPCYRRG